MLTSLERYCRIVNFIRDPRGPLRAIILLVQFVRVVYVRKHVDESDPENFYAISSRRRKLFRKRVRVEVGLSSL